MGFEKKLSDTKPLDNSTLVGILDILEVQGYETEKIEFTLQD